MSSSTAKRVILYRFDRQPLEGYVNPNTYLLQSGIEIITSNGNLETAGYGDVKAVCFASETGSYDLFTASQLFDRRPKLSGLWTRFTFRDNDQLDGILSHNLLEWPESGYSMTPPRAGAARQRVFVPRAALIRTELLGVVGVAVRSKPKRESATAQLRMFEP